MQIGRRASAAPRETFAVFQDAERLESAITDLCISGFDRADFSLLAREGTLRDPFCRIHTVLHDAAKFAPHAGYALGASTVEGQGFAVSLLIYAGALAASLGVGLHEEPLATIIAAAILGGGFGALLGAVLARLLDQRRNALFNEQLARGAVLLWVRTADRIKEATATRILARHAASDLRRNRFAGRARLAWDCRILPASRDFP